MYLIGFIVPILAYFLRIWPRIINRYFGVDTWRWLYFADYLRNTISGYCAAATTTRTTGYTSSSDSNAGDTGDGSI